VVKEKLFAGWRSDCIFLSQLRVWKGYEQNLAESFGELTGSRDPEGKESADGTLRNSRADGVGSWNINECSEFAEQSSQRFGTGPDERVGNGFGKRFASEQSGSINGPASLKNVPSDVGVGLGQYLEFRVGECGRKFFEHCIWDAD